MKFMNKYLFLLSFLLIGVVFNAGKAHAIYDIKDSFYFMKDDGVFSDEEKDEEAMYVYGQCAGNSMQRVYYNCACIAGAFRQIRDEDGDNIRPQSTILQTLYRSDARGCVNEERIAGDAYQLCSEYAISLRKRASDNEDYCSCVANTMVDKFTDDPKLISIHIQRLRTKAFVECEPSNKRALQVIEQKRIQQR